MNGYLEVISGPMYSGKTEELIRQVKRAVIGKKNVQVFKHAIDIRYGKEKKLFSHAGMSFECDVAKTPEEILHKTLSGTELVGIDEAQWFGPGLVPAAIQLLEKNKHVVISGLAMTFYRQPFVPIPELMAMADKVTKLSAVCSLCGADAVFHKRIKNGTAADPLSTDPSLVGGTEDDAYEARCRKCFNL